MHDNIDALRLGAFPTISAPGNAKKWRSILLALRLCGAMAVFGAGTLSASDIQAPFPIPIAHFRGDFAVDSAWKGIPVISATAGEFTGEAQFQYDEEALYLRAMVGNPERRFAPAEALTKNACRLYEYDSVEFWLGRHQYTVGIAGGRGGAFDYTVGKRLDEAAVTGKPSPEGYEIVARLPWKSLDFQPEKRKLLLLSVWFNKMARTGGTLARSQAWIPATAEWDRPSTYGAAFLNDTIPLDKCAPVLAPLAEVSIETAAALAQDRLILGSSPVYGALDFRCVVGRRFEQTVRSGASPVLLALPVAPIPEISRLDLYATFPGGDSFGPLSVEYFSHGSQPLSDYRSSRELPKDFDAFWDARLAELAREPLESVRRLVDRPNPVADLWEVTLRSWRGVKIVAYVSVPKASGKYPLSLWVYPAAAIEAKDMPMPGNEVVLAVNPRGFGPSEKFCPKPDQIYVSDAKIPENFYLLANILDVIRGIDYALTLDQVDASRIFVGGGSRGGYLTLALAANDPRISVASATVPCYADVDMMGRLGSGSAASDAFLAWNGGTPERRHSLRNIWPYFDAVNLAHRIRCAIVVEAGMTDTICAAPGIVDAFNRIASPKKILILNPELGHTGTKLGGDIIHSLLQAEAGR